MYSFLCLSLWSAAGLVALVVINIIRQLLPRKGTEPPVVFHWVPFVGSAVTYGIDPHKFLVSCREKHGDVFTFIMFGRKMTCCLGLKGNEFILNGRHADLNAEEIYNPLTRPVFGPDIVYDCPNSKLMEQKRFMKYGLTHQAHEIHVPLIEKEVLQYVSSAPSFKGERGTVDISSSMAEVTIFTAGRALQGKEVREKLSNEMASLYHDMDMGFKPINFLLPWAPLPHNFRRDKARAKMEAIYRKIIDERRRLGREKVDDATDMIANLMGCKYKNGNPVPDSEIVNIMITLLMGGQHSSSSASSWILLRLASQPEVCEELYQEQMKVLAKDGQLPPLRYADLDRLPLLQGTIKETLRCHSSITSIMRKVSNPLPIPGTPYIVTTDKVLLSSPVITAMSEEFFPNASTWDPHRWLDRADDDEEIVDYGYGATSKGTKSPYLPFGAGRHRCIGEKFAYLNLGAIVTTIVRNFKLSTLDGSRTVPDTDYNSLFSGPKKPAFIRWERRKTATA
ncbi:cytochrome P450 [Dendryphion nanum]|uniref:Cytochrome P450 n=1 Tax=Dendryphion nanum TaxID=256645 RepID=A0A9P9D6H1_9PLEO|nr:cytochrome P450 [Dendryphion nanum]